MCFNIILRVKKSTYKALKKTLSLTKISTIFKIVFRNIKKRSEKKHLFCNFSCSPFMSGVKQIVIYTKGGMQLKAKALLNCV